MSKRSKDKVFRLINSLNTAERRNFKLYSTRAGATAKSKFVLLFDIISKKGKMDDSYFLKRLNLENKSSFSNLKQHLYREVLTSLRLIYIDKEIDIELREQIDFTRILYGKGHYLDALTLLERAKAKAIKHGQDILHLEIMEFQKMIEARHITNSRKTANKMDFLVNESSTITRSMQNTSELLNMSIQIHGRYIELGHSRTKEDFVQNRLFWESIQTKRADSESASSTFHQRMHRAQATMWYHYIQLDFMDAMEAAREVMGLFSTSQQMIVKDPDLYLRSLYYLVVFSYLTNAPNDLKKYTDRMEAFLTNGKAQLNENSRQIGLTYLNLSRFNDFFLTGKSKEAYNLSRKVLIDYEARDFRPNDQRWGLLLYKSAASCFLTKRFDEALDYLNEVDNMQGGILREDLLINTRLLHALCNFELEHYDLVDTRLSNLQRLLKRSKETANIHLLTSATLRRLLKLPKAQHAEVFKSMQQDLSVMQHDPFEQKTLAYFNPQIWLDIHASQRSSV